MNDITAALLRYRECSRSLWNEYLLGPSADIGWDVADDFRQITGILFRRLVLDIIGVEILGTDSDTILPYIRIVPLHRETPIMINRPSTDGCNYWDDPINRVCAADVHLQFVEFFDWQDLAVRDFRFYKTVIRQFDKYPDRVGRMALIEVGDSTAELES